MLWMYALFFLVIVVDNVSAVDSKKRKRHSDSAESINHDQSNDNVNTRVKRSRRYTWYDSSATDEEEHSSSDDAEREWTSDDDTEAPYSSMQDDEVKQLVTCVYYRNNRARAQRTPNGYYLVFNQRLIDATGALNKSKD